MTKSNGIGVGWDQIASIGKFCGTTEQYLLSVVKLGKHYLLFGRGGVKAKISCPLTSKQDAQFLSYLVQK